MELGAGGGRSAVAVAFPGQGAQSAGLGLAWRDTSHWAVVERAESAAGVPLAPLLLEATADDLKRTRAAQLAVFLTSLMAWDALQEAQPALSVAALTGHSLGEVTALVASGAIDFDEGVRFAAARAEATQRCADAGGHAMAALIGATYEQAEAACAASGECWIANDNGGGQVVIAGTAAGVDAADAVARGLGVRRVIALNVGGAFHTPLMGPAADELRSILTSVTFRVASAPVVCNTDGEFVTGPEQWPSRLAAHLVQPVRWYGVLSSLAAAGIGHLVEVGPGQTLTGLAKRAGVPLETANVTSPEDAANLTIGVHA